MNLMNAYLKNQQVEQMSELYNSAVNATTSRNIFGADKEEQKKVIKKVKKVEKKEEGLKCKKEM